MEEKKEDNTMNTFVPNVSNVSNLVTSTFGTDFTAKNTSQSIFAKGVRLAISKGKTHYPPRHCVLYHYKPVLIWSMVGNL